jgi:hypothetical protein
VTSFDDETRAHFDDLRAEDSAHAPEFSALWRDAEHRANALPSSRRVHRTWWLAAAASAIVAATLLVRQATHEKGTGDAAVADTTGYPSIVSWTSPTDGLLRMSQQQTITSPSILGSVLDGVPTLPMKPDLSKRGGL